MPLILILVGLAAGWCLYKYGGDWLNKLKSSVSSDPQSAPAPAQNPAPAAQPPAQESGESNSAQNIVDAFKKKWGIPDLAKPAAPAASATPAPAASPAPATAASEDKTPPPAA